MVYTGSMLTPSWSPVKSQSYPQSRLWLSSRASSIYIIHHHVHIIQRRSKSRSQSSSSLLDAHMPTDMNYAKAYLYVDEDAFSPPDPQLHHHYYQHSAHVVARQQHHQRYQQNKYAIDRHGIVIVLNTVAFRGQLTSWRRNRADVAMAMFMGMDFIRWPAALVVVVLRL